MALGEAVGRLLEGNYAIMMKGLVVRQGVQIANLNANGNFGAAEDAMGFVVEWIWIGVNVKGHSLIARGLTSVFAKGAEALERSNAWN